MGLDEFAPPCSWMITRIEDYSYFLTKAFVQIPSVIKKYMLNNIYIKVMCVYSKFPT